MRLQHGGAHLSLASVLRLRSDELLVVKGLIRDQEVFQHGRSIPLGVGIWVIPGISACWWGEWGSLDRFGYNDRQADSSGFVSAT